MIVLRDGGLKVRATRWRGVHWHGKMESVDKAGESKKHQFWPREEKRRSKTGMYKANTYEIILYAKGAQERVSIPLFTRPFSLGFLKLTPHRHLQGFYLHRTVKSRIFGVRLSSS